MKLKRIVIIMMKVIGDLCLAYFAIPYISHDTFIKNPDAMLPVENWDWSGMILTVGLIPLLIVNILCYIYIGREKLNVKQRLLFIIPCIICLCIVIDYWIFSFVSI